MKKTLIFFLIIFGLILSCKKKSKELSENDNLQEVKKTDSLSLLLNNLDSVEILSFKKEYMETSIPDTTICLNWNLKKTDLITIIKTTKQIDFEDLHYLFETQSCIYKGEIKLLNKKYAFTINSGGWLNLKYGNLTLGCFDESCEMFFLGKVDKPKEEFKNYK